MVDSTKAAAMLNKSASADSGLFFKSVSRELAAPKKKKVRFSNVTNVILVPTRQDYFDHNLNKKLWWTEEDYNAFKKSAVREVSALINIYRIDAKTALARLGLCEQLSGDNSAAISDTGTSLEFPAGITACHSEGNLIRPRHTGGANSNHQWSLSSRAPSLSHIPADKSASFDKSCENVFLNMKARPFESTEVFTSLNSLPSNAVKLPSPKRSGGSGGSSSSSSGTSGCSTDLGMGVASTKASGAMHPLAYIAGF